MNLPFPDGVAAVPVDQCGPEHDKPRQHLFAADLQLQDGAGVTVECLPADDDFLVHVTIAPAGGVEAFGFVLDAQDAAGFAATLAAACAAQLAAMNDAAHGDLFDSADAADAPESAGPSPAPPIGAGVPCDHESDAGLFMGSRELAPSGACSWCGVIGGNVACSVCCPICNAEVAAGTYGQ